MFTPEDKMHVALGETDNVRPKRNEYLTLPDILCNVTNNTAKKATR